jgi:hypothetical protein
MNPQILNFKLGDAQGVEQACENQVFLQPRYAFS